MWKRDQASNQVTDWRANGSARVVNLAGGPGAFPVAWRVSLFTTAPASGVWRVDCGSTTDVPIFLTPAPNGSDVIEVSGTGVAVYWLPVVDSGVGDRVAACAAPTYSTAADWD